MNFLIGKLCSLVVAALAILLLIITGGIFSINRKKGWLSLLLSLIYVFFTGYYIYLTFYLKPPRSILKEDFIVSSAVKSSAVEEKKVPVPKEIKTEEDTLVLLRIENHTISARLEDEIEISKDTKFKIENVKTSGKDVKANVIGFVGNRRRNDGQDIGYWIKYTDMMKRRALDKDGSKFKITIKSDNQQLGNIYIKFN
jgi:hypothetical protein